MSELRTETEQELFWKSNFGDEYVERCVYLSKDREPFFRKLDLITDSNIKSVCELGANIGENLRALQAVRPDLKLKAVEINRKAFEKLLTVPGVSAEHASIQDFDPQETFDLVFSSGVLIHINPDDLVQVYRKMFDLSNRYILINEYFNPTPVEINYRGHEKKLFKRDFAGEFLDHFHSKVRVVDYGFLWKKLQPVWDNSTWTIFEKISG